jgi:hypothetical protein
MLRAQQEQQILEAVVAVVEITLPMLATAVLVLFFYVIPLNTLFRLEQVWPDQRPLVMEHLPLQLLHPVQAQ